MFSLEISYHVRRFSREKFRLVEKRLISVAGDEAFGIEL